MGKVAISGVVGVMPGWGDFGYLSGRFIVLIRVRADNFSDCLIKF